MLRKAGTTRNRFSAPRPRWLARLVIVALLVNLVAPSAALIASEQTGTAPWSPSWAPICHDQGSSGGDGASGDMSHHHVRCPLCIVLGSQLTAPTVGLHFAVAPPVIIVHGTLSQEKAEPVHERVVTPQQARAPPIPA